LKRLQKTINISNCWKKQRNWSIQGGWRHLCISSVISLCRFDR